MRKNRGAASIEMDKDLDINFAQGAEEIGLAVMLKELLTQNLELNPHKLSDFKKLNIGVGLIVPDVEIELIMEFLRGTLTIHPGIKGKPKLIITSEADIVMALSNVRIKWGLPYYFDEAGKEIIRAMRTGRLKIKGIVMHLPSLIRLSRVMSVH